MLISNIIRAGLLLFQKSIKALQMKNQYYSQLLPYRKALVCLHNSNFIYSLME